MKIEKQLFGYFQKNKRADLYTLTNNHNVKINITNYGGIVTSIIVPDKSGNYDDVVLGFDNLEGYLSDHPFFGTLVGRYANRIANGKFVINGIEYQLAKNNGENHLHGGIRGFDKVLWEAREINKNEYVGVELSYISQNMEEGYPGNVNTRVILSLNNDNEFRIDYFAATDKTTHVNLTHHGYFNLNGCRNDVLSHEVYINANEYTPVNENSIPTGKIEPVAGTPFDFNKISTLGSRIGQLNNGYDHNYVLNKKAGSLSLAAKVIDKISGRVMEIFTTEPGIQLYTSNYLDGSITGKNKIAYKKHFGVCFEAQHFPDSPNQPGFPSTILNPGEKYSQTTIHKFSLIK